MIVIKRTISNQQIFRIPGLLILQQDNLRSAQLNEFGIHDTKQLNPQSRNLALRKAMIILA